MYLICMPLRFRCNSYLLFLYFCYSQNPEKNQYVSIYIFHMICMRCWWEGKREMWWLPSKRCLWIKSMYAKYTCNACLIIFISYLSSIINNIYVLLYAAGCSLITSVPK